MELNGIVITGKLVNRERLTQTLVKRISWIADIFIYPGENDLQALNEGILRVLRHEESPKEYPSTNA